MDTVDNLQRSRKCWTTTENRDEHRDRRVWRASRRRTDRETQTLHSLPTQQITTL